VTRVYLDTSVFVNLFHDDEKNWELVERISELAKNKKVEIAVSDWVINESIWTVEKKVQKGRIDPGEAFKIINLIADFVAEGVEDGWIIWLGFPSDAVANSRVIIEEMRCSAADALHLYLAHTSSCDYFLSADEDLVTQIKFSDVRLQGIYLHDPRDMNRFFKFIA
jgi:predicted nucleic acid-binding protein